MARRETYCWRSAHPIDNFRFGSTGIRACVVSPEWELKTTQARMPVLLGQIRKCNWKTADFTGEGRSNMILFPSMAIQAFLSRRGFMAMAASAAALHGQKRKHVPVG